MRRRAQARRVLPCRRSMVRLIGAGLSGCLFVVSISSVPAASADGRELAASQQGGATTALARGDGVLWSVIGPRVVAWDRTGERRLGASRPMPEIPRALAVARSQLYVAADDPRAALPAQLRIFDPTNPVLPIELGDLSLEPARRVGDLVADGAFVHVLTEIGLLTVDVKRPRAARRVGRLELWGPSWNDAETPLWAIERPGRMARFGDRIVVAGPHGLQLVDLDDPSAPRLLSTLAGLSAGDVAIHDDRAYVLSVAQGLVVVSLADPMRPTIIDRVDLGQAASEDGPSLDIESPLAITLSDAGDRLAILDRQGRRVLLFDLTVPDQPKLIHHRGIGAARSRLGDMLWLAGSTTGEADRLMTASALGGIVIVDSEDMLGSPRRPTRAMIPPVAQVAVVAERVVAAAGTRGVLLLERLPVGLEPAQSGLDAAHEPLSMIDVAAVVSPSGEYADVRRVAAKGDGSVIYAWTAEHGMAVLTMDPRMGGSARSVDWLPFVPGPTHGAALLVVRDHLYLADHEGVLRLIDATDPRRPSQRIVSSTLAVRDFALHGDQLVVVGGNARSAFLNVIDVADPAQPRTVGAVALPTTFEHVAFDGRYAFVLGDRPGLAIYDLSAPAHPRLLKRFPGFPAGAAQVLGKRLLVLGRDGLRSWDLRLPDFPRPKPEEDVDLPDGLVGGADGARTFVPFGDRLIVAREAAGLYDIPAPSRPNAPPLPPDVPAPPTVSNPNVRYLPAVFTSSATKARLAEPVAQEREPACGLSVTLIIDGSSAGHTAARRVDALAQSLFAELAADPWSETIGISAVRFDRQAQLLVSGMRPDSALPRRVDFEAAPRDGARIDLGLVAAGLAADVLDAGSGTATPPRRRHAILLSAALPVNASDPDRLARPMAALESDRLRAEDMQLHAVALGAEPDLAFLSRLTGGTRRIHAPKPGQEQASAAEIADGLLADRAACGERAIAGR